MHTVIHVRWLPPSSCSFFITLFIFLFFVCSANVVARAVIVAKVLSSSLSTWNTKSIPFSSSEHIVKSQQNLVGWLVG